MTENNGAARYTLKDVIGKLDDLTSLVTDIRLAQARFETTQNTHARQINTNTEDVGTIKKFMWKLSGAGVVLSVFITTLRERLIGE